MTNNQLAENSVIQLLNSVKLARDNAERADNRVDHSFYYALTIALEELQERRKADSEPVASLNCVTAEHRRVIEMLLTVCGAAFELADDSCQQDFDGEECHVVPDDAFQKLSDALDEIENTLPTEDTDRPDVFLVWSAVPRAALKSILHAQPAPVCIPTFEEWCDRTEQKPVGWVRDAMKEAYDACRAAMLSGGKS